MRANHRLPRRDVSVTFSIISHGSVRVRDARRLSITNQPDDYWLETRQELQVLRCQPFAVLGQEALARGAQACEAPDQPVPEQPTARPAMELQGPLARRQGPGPANPGSARKAFARGIARPAPQSGVRCLPACGPARSSQSRQLRFGCGSPLQPLWRNARLGAGFEQGGQFGLEQGDFIFDAGGATQLSGSQVDHDNASEARRPDAVKLFNGHAAADARDEKAS
jgi:hypothetical protein